MSRTFRKNIGLSVVTSVIALALSGVPFSLDTHSGSPGINAAIAAPGNGNGKGQANGNGKSRGAEKSQQAKAAHAKGHVSKDDPMHPSNLGRLNGFLNASPQALKNTSANSAIGVLSKTYRDALLGYTTSSEESEETVSTEDLAAILAKAANKPLTGEQVLAIHEKLIAENPELADAVTPDETETDDETEADDETVDLTDPDFADQLADEANAIQATETNQGLGSSGDDAADGEGGVGEALTDAGEAVATAAEDTADAIGGFFDETF
jgi:hypothetical protein